MVDVPVKKQRHVPVVQMLGEFLLKKKTLSRYSAPIAMLQPKRMLLTTVLVSRWIFLKFLDILGPSYSTFPQVLP